MVVVDSTSFALTLDKMKTPSSSLFSSRVPFCGIILGKEVMLLGWVYLHVTFSESDNFQKELLTFEVVDFLGTYHAFAPAVVFHEVHGRFQWSHHCQHHLPTGLLL